MRVRKPNQNEQALLEFLGCEPTDMKRHSPTVYEWRGLFLEVLTDEQVKNGKVPASWYSGLIPGFKVREMGKQAAIVKKIRRRKV